MCYPSYPFLGAPFADKWLDWKQDPQKSGAEKGGGWNIYPSVRVCVKFILIFLCLELFFWSFFCCLPRSCQELSLLFKPIGWFSVDFVKDIWPILCTILKPELNLLILFIFLSVFSGWGGIRGRTRLSAPQGLSFFGSAAKELRRVLVLSLLSSVSSCPGVCGNAFCLLGCSNAPTMTNESWRAALLRQMRRDWRKHCGHKCRASMLWL